MTDPTEKVAVEQRHRDAAYEFTRTGWMKGSDGIGILAQIVANFEARLRTPSETEQEPAGPLPSTDYCPSSPAPLSALVPDGPRSLSDGRDASSEAPPVTSSASQAEQGGVDITTTEILREWFGGERCARDHEYLDANYSAQARNVARYIAALREPAPEGEKP